MISILIPTYHYNIAPLVGALHQEALLLDVPFEILVFDDASGSFLEENGSINKLSNTQFVPLQHNIGRSAIRNLLAVKAKFENLLFLDADTQIIKPDFIKNYLNALQPDSQIIYGGIVYQAQQPAKSELLRWVYGNEREALPVTERNKAPYLRFLTLNFLIKRSVFNEHRFNEDIPNLRHEDTLFALGAKKLQLHITHIDNPVIHLGLESSEVFLKKSLESVDALHLFVKMKLIDAKETSLSNKGAALKNGVTTSISGLFIKLYKKRIERNLTSSKPSLFWFDVYRLAYYLTLESAKDD